MKTNMDMKTIQLSQRIQAVQPFRVMDVVRQARAMTDVIHLEIGEPDLAPSPNVKLALHAALDQQKMGYTNSLGLHELRIKIANYYQQRYQIELDPQRVIVTVGTSGAFLLIYALLLDAGDQLLLTDPCYPCYKNFAHILNIKPQFARVDAANNYQLSPAQLAQYPHAKAVQISSPSNPTGTVYQPTHLAALIDACEAQNTWFISDEIYHGLVYGDAAKSLQTALHYSDNAIVINSFSKYFSLPGLRLGWMIVPDALVRSAEIMMQNLVISAPTLSQYGALAAFDQQHLNHMTATYAQRRDYLYQALQPLFKLDAQPDGGLYIWANCSAYQQHSSEFAQRVLTQAKVAVTPGIDFSQHQAQDYIRFAYTQPLDKLHIAVARLRDLLL